MVGIGLRLTPYGRLVVENQDDAPGIDHATSIRLTEAFVGGTGHGLVRLGAAEVGQTLPPVFVWWRDFAARYIGSLCLHASGTKAEDSRKPPSVILGTPAVAALPIGLARRSSIFSTICGRRWAVNSPADFFTAYQTQQFCGGTIPRWYRIKN